MHSLLYWFSFEYGNGELLPSPDPGGAAQKKREKFWPTAFFYLESTSPSLWAEARYLHDSELKMESVFLSAYSAGVSK